MGLEVENKNNYRFFDEINVQEETLNVAYLIIPFSVLFKKKSFSRYIYWKRNDIISRKRF